MSGARPGPLVRGLRLASLVLALVGLAGLLGGSALALSARWFWLGEIVASFRWYLGLGGLATALLFALAPRWRAAAFALMLALVHLGPGLLLHAPSHAAPPATARRELVVASVNLLFENRRSELLRDFLAAERPDVVGLQELCEFWRDRLIELERDYPHRLLWPKEDEAWPPETFGIGLLSRHPIEGAAVHPVDRGTPFLVADVRVGGRPLQVVVAHPTRPGRAHRIARRDAAIRRIADEVDWGRPTVLLADLNATVHSPIYGELLDASGLRNARRGFGRLPTWRTQRRVPGLWIGIDHVLVAGDSIGVVDCRTGPDLGSDHLPLLATLGIVDSASRR